MRKKMLVTFAMMICLAMPMTVNASTEQTDIPVAQTETPAVQEEADGKVNANGLADPTEANKWVKDGNDWYYSVEVKGTATPNYDWVKGAACEIGGKTYYFDDAGKMFQGGQKEITGETEDANIDVSVHLDEGTYYFIKAAEGVEDPSAGGALGSMVKGAWAEEHKYGADGLMLFTKWDTDESGKEVYLDAAGDIVKNQWKERDDGSIVFLDADGHINTPDGEQNTGMGIYFFKDGAFVKNEWETTAKGKIHFYGENGKLAVSQWLTKDGKPVWVNANGDIETKTGFVKTGSDLYYIKADGTFAKNEWVKDGGKWYYAGNESKMLKGLINVGRKYYYMDNNYQMMTAGWQHASDGYWYVMESSGAIKTSQWYASKGVWYYLNSDGKMAVDQWAKDKAGKWYYLKADGKMAKGQWVSSKGKWYYVDGSGVMKTGWLKSKNKWYYLTPGNGVMKLGWAKISGKWYFLNSPNGDMKTGWLMDNGVWYYLKPNGDMVTGWAKVNGKWYYMNKSGEMQEGWTKVGGTWYYLQSSGAMKTGWLQEGSNWYYLRSNGSMVASGTELINGKVYYFNGSGVWSKLTAGWHMLDGFKMYVDASGGIVQDTTGMLTAAQKKAGYYITINRVNCVVTIYAKDLSTGKYNIPVKALRCSVGKAGTATPTGTYSIHEQERWHTLMGPSYGQYCSRIVGGVWFHSVAGITMNSYGISSADYNMLGSPASHGCVRLNVRDAKWIYDNCKSGTTVYISDTCAQPLAKPAGIKIPTGQRYDPTDPAV